MTVRSVLYVVGFAFPGSTGTPLHAMGMAEVMRDRGLDVHVAQLRPWPLWKSEMDAWNGIPVHRLGRPGWRWRLRNLIDELQPDVVHAHHVAAGVFSLQPCKSRGVPLIYECHSFWREEIAEAGGRPSPVQRYVGWREKNLFKQCDHIIALSEKMKRTHVAEIGIDARKFTVIYPGVRSDWIDNHDIVPAEIPGVSKDDFVVMYCGNFAQYQGVDLLLGGMDRAMQAAPETKVVLVGATEAENEAKRRKWGDLAGHVVYAGRFPHEEMPSVFALADVLVIPRPDSRICWTMPRKFGEYLSAGKPLLVTDVSDYRRTVEHFDCGVVTDCTPEGIADGVVRLAEASGDEMNSMGHGALAAAQAWFDWDRQMDQVLGLYEQLLAGDI